MEQLPTVVLRPGEADRVVGGHPWIYAGSVHRLTIPANDGDLVQVKDSRARFLGVGFYNSKSKINVRVLDHDRITVDEAFFTTRISEALAHRKKWLPKATSFRVVNAESDFLSGLIVDKYEDVLVVQTSSLGMDQRLPLIVNALKNVLSPKAILERNEIGSRKFEGLEERRGVLFGEAPAVATMALNGLNFEVDVAGGHKTGYYLDQQVNYDLVARLTPGMSVLDCFTFQGGFALHAARAGALRVLALDQSEEALAVARKNAERNGLADKCAFEAVNVFDWLKQHGSAAPNEKVIPRYDVIILDPPSFTRTRSAIGDALRGYKEIHLRALKLIKRGGTLATFCCSHHIDAVKFQEVILEAAFDAHRLVRRVATYTQSPDHPIIPSIPETEYLKGFAFEVVR
jgi:23S rRNA (cytosine1962-C5)-methyltransferase